MVRLNDIPGRAIAAIVFAVATSWSAEASADEKPTLTIGWTLAPPAFETGPDGEHTGYFVEFARLLGKEIEHEVQILPYAHIGELVRAQNSGETQLLAGSPSFAMFSENNLFSRPVGESRYVLFGLASRLNDLDPADEGSMRVAALPGRPPEVQAYLQRQVEVPISGSGEGLFALLSQDLDAILFPEELVQGWTYRAGVDHLVLPISEPVSRAQRVVVLHRSRAALLPSINTAITRLEADGTLPQLRRKYLMQHFEPEPEVLTVGVPEIIQELDYTPYYLMDEDGEYSGFSIELFHELAASAGLRYRLKTISFASMTQGPDTAGVDIVPLFAIPTDRPGFSDHTLPTEELLVTATVLQNNAAEIQSLEDLSGARVGVLAGTFAHRMALKNDSLEVITFEPAGGLLDALMNGEITAALETKGYVSAKAEGRGIADQVNELSPALYRSERGIHLRFGLGKVRERLNTAIGSYILSDGYASLKQKYFGKPVFWTETRQRIAVATLGAAAMLVFAFGSALIMSDRARRRVTSAHDEAKLAHTEAEQARRDAETLRHHAELLAVETLDATSQLRAMMEAAQSGILGLNRDGRIVVANPVARKMLGIDKLSVPTQWPAHVTFLHANSSQPLLDGENPLARALSKDQLSGEVFRMHSEADGEIRCVRLVSSLLPLDTSPEIGTLLMIDDVTEQESNRARVERYDRLSMVGQLTGGVAHDFNNLLAVILSRQELLRDSLTDDVLLGHIDASIGAANRGADLTGSMLAFAQKAPLLPQKIDVNEMVEETRTLAARTIASNITLETRLAKDPGPIEVDAAAAESALLNLILNARDAMPSGGTLSIRTTSIEITDKVSGLPETMQPGAYVMISVTDTGQGISEDVLPRIFEPFFTTKAPGQGSGLGLSMIQGFMEQSGGGARVSSEPGKGTTFQLYFPATSDLTDDVPIPDSEAIIESSGQRILLVEDNAEVLAVLDVMLCNAGYAVTTAGSGDQALTIFENDPHFDLVLTDVMMPGDLDGVNLTVLLRARMPGLPVITMSGYSDAHLPDTCAKGGCFQLSKPVSRAKLLSAVSKALERSMSAIS